MNETAKITFFNVNKCGYYSRSGSRRALKREFGDLKSTLFQLKQWVRGAQEVQLAQTQTYAPSAVGDLLPAYVFDIAESSGEWLLVLWNQTPAGEKAVASVHPNELVGKAAVIENDIAKGSVPGFPSYYWFQPEHSRMAGVRFEFAVAGHCQLRAYLQGFLARSATHAVAQEAVGSGLVAAGLEVLGYREHVGDEPRQDVEPIFRSGLHRLRGDIAHILNHHDSIRKIIHHTTLELGRRQEDLAFWQMMWRKVRGAPAQTDGEVRVSYEMNTKVTTDQIKELVNSYEEASQSWDDLGFVFKGDNSIHWLSKAYARGEFTLQVERVAPSVVSAESLLKALQGNRKLIERIL